MPETSDSDLIRQGAIILRSALYTGKVTLNHIHAEQRRDIETVRVREYWGDRNEGQRLITQGIKLRIAARK